LLIVITKKVVTAGAHPHQPYILIFGLLKG